MLNIVFAGTPDFTIPTLDFLVNNHSLIAIITAPPRKQGRKMEVKNSPIFNYAMLLKKEEKISENFPIFAPEKLDDDFVFSLSNLKPDLLISFAYGKIFSKEFIAIFKKGGINIHPSLLPKLRGPSPVSSSILKGEAESGVSIQTIREKVDSGEILLQEPFRIEKGETTNMVLSGKVANMSVSLLKKVLDDFDSYLKHAKVQNESDATYCHLLKKSDGLIDWSKEAKEIECQVNAFSSWPCTYTFCNGKKLNIIEVHVYNGKKEIELKGTFGAVLGKDLKEGILVETGKGILCITKLQWETKKVLMWKDFLNGSSYILSSIFKNVSL